jgi:hypothetical protein
MQGNSRWNEVYVANICMKTQIFKFSAVCEIIRESIITDIRIRYSCVVIQYIWLTYESKNVCCMYFQDDQNLAKFCMSMPIGRIYENYA